MNIPGSSTRSGEAQEGRDETSASISERLDRLHLGGSIPTDDSNAVPSYLGNENVEPRTGTVTHLSSRAESSISNSQITLGRDMNSYQMATEGERSVSENKSHEIDEDDGIAAGMMIPVPPPCILERDSQHAQIVNKLLSLPNAKVAVLGMGGIGKTTLACSVASDSQIVDAFPRRLFLAFEGCSTPDLAYTSLATAFQVPANRRSSHQQILLHVLNYLKQEKTLFIIDNFETFWDVSSNRRSAENFLSQLGALQKLAIVVTLRGIQRPGNIHWIKVEPLQTLTHDASKELLSIIIDEEDCSEVDSEYIQKLLDAVAGIPLAITLIGYLLRDGSETPQSLWSQWTRESARAIRVASEVDSDDRLYKLDISLRLSIFGPRMSENTKEVLAAISILPIGITIEEGWLDELQTLLPSTIRLRDCIRTLRDVALATLDSSTSPPRLKLLSPVRDFCLNNLPLDGELPLRLIDLYNTNIREHWDCGSNEHYTWVNAELSNLPVILDHAMTLRYVTDDFGYAAFCYTQWRQFIGMPDIDTIQRAIDVLSEHPIQRAECLQAFGDILINSDRSQEAIQQLEHALSIHREAGDKFKEGWDLYLLGFAHYRLGDHADAERCLNEAGGLYSHIDTGNQWSKGSVLRVLSDTYVAQGKLSEAESTAKEALELCRASNHRIGEVRSLGVLGEVYRKQGKFDPALDTMTAVRNASQVIHDIYYEAWANEQLGLLYHDTNQFDQVARQFQLAGSLYEQIQDFKAAERVRSNMQYLGAYGIVDSE